MAGIWKTLTRPRVRDTLAVFGTKRAGRSGRGITTAGVPLTVPEIQERFGVNAEAAAEIAARPARAPQETSC
jgi:hypothetical protein